MKKPLPVCQHVGIFVHDLEKVNRFYTRHLGFKIERDHVADRKITKQIFGINSSCRLQYLSLKGFGIELLYFQDTHLIKRRAKTSGTNHWTLLVEDKFEFCRNLKRKKIKVIEVDKSNSVTYFIKDPEENLIEIKNHEDSRSAKKRY